MSFLSKILNLKVRMYPLYIETFFVAGIVRLLIFSFPFKRISSLLSHLQGNFIDCSSRKYFLIEEITLAVNRVAKYTPWRCQCLEQGLTGKIILRQCGINSKLVFGVAQTHEKEIIAHAWLQCGEKIVIGEKGSESFRIIAIF